MKKVSIKIFTMLSILALIIVFSPQSSAIGDCEEDGLPASLVFFQYDYDHPLNCAYAGNGCTSCTSTPIEN